MRITKGLTAKEIAANLNAGRHKSCYGKLWRGLPRLEAA